MEEATASPATVAVQQQQQHEEKKKKSATSAKRDYKGFVAGVFSGIAKLTGKSTQLPITSYSLIHSSPPPLSLSTVIIS